jgi:hypothetical protein
MNWVVSYEGPLNGARAATNWVEERHPSREDALTFCDVVLRNGGVVGAVVAREEDGQVVRRLDHRDVLRELHVYED